MNLSSRCEARDQPKTRWWTKYGKLDLRDEKGHWRQEDAGESVKRWDN